MDRDWGIGFHVDTADMAYVYDKRVYREASADHTSPLFYLLKKNLKEWCNLQ